MAQACTDEMIDLEENKIRTFKDALEKNIFPLRIMENEKVKKAKQASPFDSFKRSEWGKEKLTLCQAISEGIIDEKLAFIIVDAQLSTGGLIDSRTKLRLSLKAAVVKEVLPSPRPSSMGGFLAAGPQRPPLRQIVLLSCLPSSMGGFLDDAIFHKFGRKLKN